MNKRILVILIVCFLMLLCVQFLILSKVVENFEQNKIEFVDWWGEDKKSQRNFEKIFSGVFDKYDKIKIHNAQGSTEVVKQPRLLNVQFSGESFFRNPEDFDVNFIPKTQDYKRIHVLPYGYLNILNHDQFDMDRLLRPRVYHPETKSKFCLFSVTNGSCKQRNEMFTDLSKYKQVDSCGAYMNNIGKSCPGQWWDKEYYDFISQYKFMICFENVSQPNYFTEKCINAFYSGTIPIYWGCTNIEEHINKDAILYLSPNYTPEEKEKLIQKIIELDNDENAYREMYERPFFKNGVATAGFDINQIRKKVEEALL